MRDSGILPLHRPDCTVYRAALSYSMIVAVKKAWSRSTAIASAKM